MSKNHVTTDIKAAEDALLGEQQIYEMGSVGLKCNGKNIFCLTIIGQIEGHYTLPAQDKTTKYEHVIPTLVSVSQNGKYDGILILLNTMGGDVEAGLAIAELISSVEIPTVSLVLGGGHSIGVPLAVASDYSFIASTATMTIHPVRMNGLVVGVPQTFSYFEQMQERILRFVSENSRIAKDRLRQLMMTTGEMALDVGCVLTGEKAVKEGLIDELGGLSAATKKLEALIEQDKK